MIILAACGNLEVLQDVLGRHLLIAFGQNVSLGHIQDGIALLSIFLFLSGCPR
ncbi:MAG: hypothetical protein ACJ795_14205 [Ktedonobacteraceae bacterium]